MSEESKERWEAIVLACLDALKQGVAALGWVVAVLLALFIIAAWVVGGQYHNAVQPAPVASEPVADAPAAASDAGTDAAEAASDADASEPVAPPPAAWTSKDRAAPLAPDAKLGPYERGHLDFVDTMVLEAKARGYQCDLVNAALPMIFTRGFRLVCDDYTHVYDIKDVGGTWVLSVE